MKTAIKLAEGRSVVVKPANGGGVHLSVLQHQFAFACADMTPDQVGALIFGLEQAAEAARIAQERAALAGALAG